MSESETSHRAIARWVARVIPCILAGVLVYGTYVLVSVLCIDYLHEVRGQDGAVIAILILYFLFLVPTVASYIRILWTIHTDTGLVPLRSDAQPSDDKRHRRNNSKNSKNSSGDLESQPYPAGADQDPDSPGLEQFYSKEVFVCESDGRPRWCSECRNWKPDRAHHSSELGRCVRKMDHFCPWVGGMVSETSFKFFYQFTTYCTCMCSVALGTSAYCLAMQNREGRSLNGNVAAAIAVSAFFTLFTFCMSGSSLRLILFNMTNIDAMKKNWVYQLAVRVPRDTPPNDQYTIISYPLPQPPFPNRSVLNRHGHGNEQEPTHRQPSPRDQMATKTFAVLRTQPDENPWNLGFEQNWKDVMGDNVVEWLLPIAKSPCARHESMESEYRMGPVLQQLRERSGLKSPSLEQGDVEMHEVRAN